MALIASRFRVPDWRTIYHHPENADFRRKRPDPNVIKPKDVIFVPDAVPKACDCATDKKHRFVAKRPPDLEFEVVLKDENRELFSNAAWTVRADGLELHGKTGASGSLSVRLPHGTPHAELVLDAMPWARWRLTVGGLDPVGDAVKPVVTGIQARLNNLGFPCGDVDGDIGPSTEAALAEFQRIVLVRDSPTGRIDSETLTKLVSEHGA
ncbi:MAG TPA: peptidoglycan-binding domain-containing protein [Gammaproteobacteria bacterium]|nr:peptidoglycan-binding domain-containing protein [Gammaproteobacteria bacterium]